MKESRVVRNRRDRRHGQCRYHRPRIGHQPTSEAKGRADESREEQRQNEQAAEDAAADDRVGERGYEGKQRAECPSPSDGFREGPKAPDRGARRSCSTQTAGSRTRPTRLRSHGESAPARRRGARPAHRRFRRQVQPAVLAHARRRDPASGPTSTVDVAHRFPVRLLRSATPSPAAR